MRTLTKVLLACMPATALADKEVIDLNTRGIDGSEFDVDMDDALEFHWTGPDRSAPFHVSRPPMISEPAQLDPAPYSVTVLETECKDVIVRKFSEPDQRLALYQVDGETNTWRNVMHPEFKNVFTNLEIIQGDYHGDHDWYNGHPRLLDRDSILVVDYNVPFVEIRDHYPNASFKLDSVLFIGDSNIEEFAFVDIWVNNEEYLRFQPVAPKKRGLTNLQVDLTESLKVKEQGNITVRYYYAGKQPKLYFDSFQIVVENLDIEESERQCTWKWLVEPNQQIGNSSMDSYDIRFTDSDQKDYFSTITVNGN